jgi:hypothetical protein
LSPRMRRGRPFFPPSDRFLQPPVPLFAVRTRSVARTQTPACAGCPPVWLRAIDEDSEDSHVEGPGSPGSHALAGPASCGSSSPRPYVRRARAAVLSRSDLVEVSLASARRIAS